MAAVAAALSHALLQQCCCPPRPFGPGVCGSCVRLWLCGKMPSSVPCIWLKSCSRSELSSELSSELNSGFPEQLFWSWTGEDSRLRNLGLLCFFSVLCLGWGACWCDSRGSRVSLTELPEGRDHVFWSLLYLQCPPWCLHGESSVNVQFKDRGAFSWAVANETLSCASCPCFLCTPTLLVSLQWHYCLWKWPTRILMSRPANC